MVVVMPLHPCRACLWVASSDLLQGVIRPGAGCDDAGDFGVLVTVFGAEPSRPASSSLIDADSHLQADTQRMFLELLQIEPSILTGKRCTTSIQLPVAVRQQQRECRGCASREADHLAVEYHTRAMNVDGEFNELADAIHNASTDLLRFLVNIGCWVTGRSRRLPAVGESATEHPFERFGFFRGKAVQKFVSNVVKDGWHASSDCLAFSCRGEPHDSPVFDAAYSVEQAALFE